MFYVQTPLHQQFFIDLLDGKTVDDVTFKLNEVDGMKVFFEFEGDVDVERAIAIAKNHFKTDKMAGALYYIVKPA